MTAFKTKVNNLPKGVVTKVANTPNGVIVRCIWPCGEDAWRWAPDGQWSHCLGHKGPWVITDSDHVPSEIIRLAVEANLRLATQAENQHNCRPRKPMSGLKGAYRDNKQTGLRRPWRSEIYKDGKRFHLGYFATPEEAHAAYVKAAIELFGEFARAA